MFMTGAENVFSFSMFMPIDKLRLISFIQAIRRNKVAEQLLGSSGWVGLDGCGSFRHNRYLRPHQKVRPR